MRRYAPLGCALLALALLPGTSRAAQDSNAFDDEPIDPIAVENGSAQWFPSIYGSSDQLGSLNEVTREKTVEALSLIKRNKNKLPKTYNLGELLEAGIPAFGTRIYEQTRVGPNLGPDFAGDNDIVGVEEEISTTYHIGTQVDGLSHIGVRSVFYNGFTAAELIAGSDSGAAVLGQEHVNPFITRGILLDVLSVKVAEGDLTALGDPVDGEPILASSYRITVEDLQAAMDFGDTGPITPGDVVIIRTGWSHLFSATDEVKKARYLATGPGIYLREARWLAQFRPAIIASDTWGLEVLPAPAPWTALQFFPVHQELITHHGIRIGQAFRSEELAADGVYEFVFFYTPQRAKGATGSNAAPAAVGYPTVSDD
jgi:kynurenine formamidase